MSFEYKGSILQPGDKLLKDDGILYTFEGCGDQSEYKQILLTNMTTNETKTIDFMNLKLYEEYDRIQ